MSMLSLCVFNDLYGINGLWQDEKPALYFWENECQLLFQDFLYGDGYPLSYGLRAQVARMRGQPQSRPHNWTWFQVHSEDSRREERRCQEDRDHFGRSLQHLGHRRAEGDVCWGASCCSDAGSHGCSCQKRIFDQRWIWRRSVGQLPWCR